MKNWLKSSQLFPLLVLTLCCLYILVAHFPFYQSKLDLKNLEYRYQNSQYVHLNSYKFFIDDPEVYSIAGWHYIHGEDPTTINFEHQPLAKYLMGASILLFGNAAVMQLVFACICIFLTYFLSKQILPKFISFFPSVLLIFDPLFKQQSVFAYLDVYQLAFTLALFLCVLKSREGKIWIWLSGIFLGTVFLSNSVWSGLLTALVVALFVVLKRRNQIKDFAFSQIITAATYFVGYLVFFKDHNLLEFLYLHLRQIHLFRSYVPEYPKFEIFRIVFTGLWRRWFGDFGLMPAVPWSILWPLSFVLAIFPFFTKKLKSITDPQFLFGLWVLIWLIFLSLKIVFPRYLLVILPFLYILAVMGLGKLWTTALSKRKDIIKK